MKRGRRKALYKRERVFLERSHNEAEIQRKVVRRGKNLAFSEDTCLEKERVRSNVTPRKAGVGLKRRQELKQRGGAKVLIGGDPLRRTRSHICSD